MRVQDFPAVVTMDSHGRSLHTEVGDVSRKHLEEVAAAV
jgi:tartrate dehydratase beta subunit/fumarate hydratase class I family protein